MGKELCNYCFGEGILVGFDGYHDTCNHCHGSGYEPSSIESLMYKFQYGRVDKLAQELTQERKQITKLLEQLSKNEEDRILLYSIGQTSPIMQWAKDKNGVYTYMNQALCDHFYYGNPYDLIGLNDIQIIEKHKKTYPKHNFGSICMGTDDMTIAANHPMKYFEWGIVRDKWQYVVAYKNTYKDKEGHILGSCGLAIYVTDEVEEIISIMESTTDVNSKERLKKYLARYGFGQENTYSDINIEELWKKGV